MTTSKRTITDEQYRDAAKRLWTDEGECEIDDAALISRSDDNGAYVQAWVWVPNEDATDEQK